MNTKRDILRWLSIPFVAYVLFWGSGFIVYGITRDALIEFPSIQITVFLQSLSIIGYVMFIVPRHRLEFGILSSIFYINSICTLCIIEKSAQVLWYDGLIESILLITFVSFGVWATLLRPQKSTTNSGKGRYAQRYYNFLLQHIKKLLMVAVFLSALSVFIIFIPIDDPLDFSYRVIQLSAICNIFLWSLFFIGKQLGVPTTDKVLTSLFRGALFFVTALILKFIIISALRGTM